MDILNVTPQNSHTLLEFVRQRLGLTGEAPDATQCMRYEAIARAFVAVEQGSEQPFYHWVVCTWATQYFEGLEHRRQVSAKASAAADAKPVPFASIRAGVPVGNWRYQAWLDTLETAELQALNSNVGYLAWVTEAERRAAATPCSIEAAIAVMRAERLSQRVRATLSKGD